MTDTYKIGILLQVTNNASSVLGILQRDFARTEKAATRLQAALKDLRVAGALGGVAAGMAFGLEKALKPAMEYQHQLALMKNNLNDQKQLAQAVGAAWKTSKDVLTSTPTENLKVLGETKFAFGNLEAAIQNLPKFMKMNAILASVMGKDGADQAFSGARLQELRGSVRSDDEFTRQMEAMVRTAQATGGRVGPDQFLAFAKMAAPFTTRFSDQFLYNQAPTMMQDMGAEKAGTALNTLLQAVVGGRMTKASFAMAQQAGLIDKDAKYRVGSAGTIQLEKRQWHGADLAQQNPLQWVQQYLMPALGNLPQQDQGLFLTQLFSNRNAQRAANDFLVNGWRYLKDEAQTLKPTGIASMDSLMREDPETAQRAAAAQWNKLWTTFGVQIVPKLVPLITKMAEGMDKLSGIMARHPTVTKMAGELAIAIALMTAFASGVALLSAGLRASGLLGAAAGGAGLAGKVGVLGAAVAVSPAAYSAGSRAGEWLAGKHEGLFRGLHAVVGAPLQAADWAFGTHLAAPIPSRSASTAQQPVVVQIDGRTVATVMSRKQADMAAGYNTGSALFDPRQSLLPSAY